MRLAISLTLLLLATYGQPALAQGEDLPQYRVEVIVVRNLNPVPGSELFNLSTNDFEIDEQAEEIPSMPFPASNADALELSDMVPRIANSKNFRVLSHFAWEQPGFSTEEAKRKITLRNASTGESVSGDFILTRERYLRLQMTLTMMVNGESHELSARRRMISRQVHYFDHPFFGVIAKITPLK